MAVTHKTFGDLHWYQQAGYGVGLVAYNFGSIPFGFLRISISGYYFSKHIYRRVYLKVLFPSDISKKIQAKTNLEIVDQARERFSDYRTSDEQFIFWILQFFRGLTEILVPVISSFGWTVYDLTKTFPDRNLQYGDVVKASLNIAGLNEILIARKWEQQTTDVLRVQRK